MTAIDKLVYADRFSEKQPTADFPLTFAEATEIVRYIHNLENHKYAHEEFSRKTDWVQTDKRFCIPTRLGMHRADVMMMIVADHAYDLAHQMEITHRLAEESNSLFAQRVDLKKANDDLTAERDALAARVSTLENVQRLNVSIKGNLFKRATAADALVDYLKEDVKYLLNALYGGNTEESIQRARQIQHRMGWDVEGPQDA